MNPIINSWSWVTNTAHVLFWFIFVFCNPDLIQFLSCSSLVSIQFLFCTDFGLFWYCSHCDLTLSCPFYDSVLALFLIFLTILKFCVQCVLIHDNCGPRWPNQILASLVWLAGSSLMALSWSTEVFAPRRLKANNFRAGLLFLMKFESRMISGSLPVLETSIWDDRTSKCSRKKKICNLADLF
jgi:hypothetical protein